MTQMGSNLELAVETSQLLNHDLIGGPEGPDRELEADFPGSLDPWYKSVVTDLEKVGISLL